MAHQPPQQFSVAPPDRAEVRLTLWEEETHRAITRSKQEIFRWLSTVQPGDDDHSSANPAVTYQEYRSGSPLEQAVPNRYSRSSADVTFPWVDSIKTRAQEGFITQPDSSNDAMMKFQRYAKQIETASHATIWGSCSDVGVEELSESKQSIEAPHESKIQAAIFSQHQLQSFINIMSSWIRTARVQNVVFNVQVAEISDALELFALRLGWGTPSQEHLEVMTYVLEHKRTIAENVIMKIYEDDDSAPTEALFTNASTSKGVPSIVKIEQHNTYQNLAKKRDLIKFEEDEIDMEEDDKIYMKKKEEGEGKEEDKKYMELLVGSPAFTWLHNHVIGLTRLTRSRTSDAIKNTVVHCYWREIQFASRTVPETIHLALNVEWDLEAFVEEQVIGIKRRGADENIINLESIEHTITLTGDPTDAQALTCEEYLAQTWPCIGIIVLQQIKLATQKQGITFCGLTDLEKMPAILELSAQTDHGKLTLKVTGEVYAVAEVCEIVAWITSALRASPTESAVYSCVPACFITSTYKTPQLIEKGGAFERLSINSRLDFRIRYLDDTPSGRCWHKMFNNPVVVEDYPILQRAKINTGIETSLNIISAVLHTNRVTMLDGKVYIKAFSSMLVPVLKIDDTVMWHYTFHEKGDYLWFSQHSGDHLVGIKAENLVSCRHIIGWCSAAEMNAGSPRAHLAVKKSGLQRCTPSFALKSFSISGGQFVSAGAGVTIGNKDPALRISFLGKPTVDKLEWAANQFAVLWDCDENRGWLIDGLSLLLYMLRVYLHERRQGLFGSTLLFNPDDIHEPSEPYPLAAAHFFSDQNWKNMQLKLSIRKFELYQEGTVEAAEQNQDKRKITYVLLQDRIEDLLEVLFNAVELQTKLGEREGIYYKGHLRKHLEGWDFTDFATGHFQFEPVAKQFPCVFYLGSISQDLLMPSHCSVVDLAN